LLPESSIVVKTTSVVASRPVPLMVITWPGLAAGTPPFAAVPLTSELLIPVNDSA